MTSPFLRLARQWIAGDTIDHGIERAREANSKGILGLLNLLGEDIKDINQIEGVVQEYTRLIERIEESKIKSQISVKPSQLGLAIDPEYCLQNYLKIAEQCASHSGNWLWVDMENSSFTEKTVELYKKLLSKYPNVGIAIQANMKRSESDLDTLLPLGANIRLVKGAYNESPQISFKKKKDVFENYSRLLRILFEQQDRNFFAVATHDGHLIDLAKGLSHNKTNFEFEMLMGVRDTLKSQLVGENYQVREYIPYGPAWFAYSMRRLREKKSNIFLLARSLLSS